MTSRTEILDVAQQLTQTRSFGGFSFQDVADAVGVRKPSLYHYFPSKDELAVALIQRIRKQFRDWTIYVADRGPLHKLKSYFKMLREYVGAGGRVCTGGSFISSWDTVAPAVRDEVEKLLADQTRWVADVIEAGRRAGAFRAGAVAAAEQAEWVVATTQGALMLSRVQADPERFRAITAQLEAVLTAGE